MEQRVPRRGQLRRDAGDRPQLLCGLERTIGFSVGPREQVTVFHVGRVRRDDALEQRHRLARLTESQIAGAEKELRRNQRGLELDGPLERTNRLLLVTTHRQRHAEVHQQASVARNRAHQVLIHPRGVVKGALLHGLRGSLAPPYEVIGLRTGREQENEQETSNHGA